MQPSMSFTARCSWRLGEPRRTHITYTVKNPAYRELESAEGFEIVMKQNLLILGTRLGRWGIRRVCRGSITVDR